ncbi:MAG TPA: flagellar export chaperone FliS [Polyangiaceae bacterium]|jgi:flagellar protein FliS|nr:flagellar export chaperone FliS [Polyangiaceae bacterium]
MLASAASRYEQVRVTTSSPGEILLALYDGLFRFLRGARACLEKGMRPRAAEQLSKAHAIISELYIALDHKVAPELCARLAALYDFSLERISHARATGDVRAIDDVVRILTPLREAWAVAVPQVMREQATLRSGKK